MDSTKIYTNKVNSFYTDCFQNIDFFGERFAFQFKDKNTYRSNLGGGIFFVYCLLATVYLCYTFNNLLSRVNYSFNYSFTTSLPSIINLTKNEFFLIDNNKIFQNISFLYNNYSLDEELEFQKNKTFETKNCESNISYNNNNASCFNSNITLEYNQFGYTNSIYLQMDLSSRNFSEKDIIFFEMIFQETSFNAKKVSERNLPFENVTRRQKIYFKRNKFNYFKFKFSKVEFTDNYNFLFSKVNQNKKHFNFIESIEYESNEISPQIFNLTKNGKNVIIIELEASSNLTLIEVRYQTLAEFLAEFGGLHANFFLFLSLIVRFINNFWAQQKLMNKILKFREHLKISYPNQLELIKANLKKNQLSSLTSIKLNSLPKFSNFKAMYFQNLNEDLSNIKDINNKDPNNSTFEMNSKNFALDVNLENKERTISIHHKNLSERRASLEVEKLEKHAKILAKMKKPIFFTCYEVILRKCFSKSKKLNLKNLLYRKASKKMNYYLDVLTYVKKVQEIDILKYLLLDKDQVKMFNFLTKPTISMIYSDSDDIYQNIQQNREKHSKIDNQELEEIIKSYNSVKEKDDDFNNRLFYLFDYEIDHLVLG